jgi:hypothetical protein
VLAQSIDAGLFAHAEMQALRFFLQRGTTARHNQQCDGTYNDGANVFHKWRGLMIVICAATIE